jgi:short-subunit dehydrogenase
MKLSTTEKSRLKSKYGPWAIVTGASSGIGREITRNLAEAGLNLILVARNEEALLALKKELSTCHVEIKTAAADLSQSEEVDRIIRATQHLNIGLLVASAGYGTSGSILQTSLHAEIGMLRVNCEALLILTHHFSQYFSQKKKGGIILMSSLVAFQGVPFSANYAATKAYVQSLAEALAMELKPFGVDVLAAAPGPVDSGFGLRANMKMSMSLKPSQVGVPILEALGRKTTVLPGLLTKVLVYSLRTVPRWGKVRIMKVVMGGMTEHQRK